MLEQVLGHQIGDLDATGLATLTSLQQALVNSFGDLHDPRIRQLLETYYQRSRQECQARVRDEVAWIESLRGLDPPADLLPCQDDDASDGDVDSDEQGYLGGVSGYEPGDIDYDAPGDPGDVDFEPPEPGYDDPDWDIDWESIDYE